MKNNLQAKLYLVAIESLRSANSGNPFLTKGEAFTFLNEVRRV